MTIEQLQSICQEKVSHLFQLTSRAHRLRVSPHSQIDCYVKREDELSFGISGSKLRKYASLLPYCAQCGMEVAIVGSPFSNHVLSITQLLIEWGLPFTLFLQGPPPSKKQGNFFFLSWLYPESSIVWVDSVPLKLTPEWTYSLEKQQNKSFFWVPIGGACKEAFPGSLTLALDLVRNEKDLGVAFDHIFIDSGTGMMAASLITAFHYLEKNACFHVVQLAGSKEDLLLQIDLSVQYLEELTQKPLSRPERYEVLYPTIGRSFGSTPKSVFHRIEQTARQEGFFLDPIYTAKLWNESLRQMQSLQGKALLIHSGGALSLSGFQEFAPEKGCVP